ncbi:chaplin [Streptomyces cavernicola]|uniref:Chaplin n=1 Tax=Streptomyces cavernicola TaxID=3043613 RepID=A0ABT6SEW4_9ACTN|nr:chaplin [Streptomyces sp. B-S-A6]MDI3405836.1 chaplin [Streptomyces sp. B-S-A6]
MAVASAALLLGGAGAAVADSDATGVAANSPGVLSGNVVQLPINVGVNACGNSLGLISALNPAGGNVCVNN